MNITGVSTGAVVGDKIVGPQGCEDLTVTATTADRPLTGREKAAIIAAFCPYFGDAGGVLAFLDIADDTDAFDREEPGE